MHRSSADRSLGYCILFSAVAQSLTSQSYKISFEKFDQDRRLRPSNLFIISNRTYSMSIVSLLNNDVSNIQKNICMN